MALMLADILRKVPALTVLPLIVWAIGMTVYAVSWKTQIDYQLGHVMSSLQSTATQSERIVSLEQNILFLREDVRDLKTILTNSTTITGGGK